MTSVISAIRDTIPISMFNRGLAGKIFEEVRKAGAKVVMKNNLPECVLVSPEEYAQLIDELNDARLLAAASQRMASFDPSTLVTQEEFDQRFRFSKEELDAVGEVEIEGPGTSSIYRKRNVTLLISIGLSSC